MSYLRSTADVASSANWYSATTDPTLHAASSHHTSGRADASSTSSCQQVDSYLVSTVASARRQHSHGTIGSEDRTSQALTPIEQRAAPLLQSNFEADEIGQSLH
ncbi:unnamed protein product [Jaminaea pallidilutea]